MHEPFTSSRAKIARAEQHRKVIEPEIKAFVESNPIALRSQHNLKGADDPIRFVYFVASIIRPPQHWALVAGDSIQNLRAALDHAVWELVVKEKGAKFAEANAPKIDFPIVDKSASFPSGRLAQIGLSEPTITVIETAQPYSRQQDAPRRDALWYLRELSNVDKHRLLHVVSMIGEEGQIRTTPFLANGNVEFVTEGPLSNGAEVVRFTASRPATYTKVEVEFELTISVSIEATPKTGGIGIDLGLRVMRDRVIEIIDALTEASRGKRSRKR